jgi:long-chain acyl-CoA synthetase
LTELRSGRSLTYGAVRTAADDVERTLRAAGVVPGQRIALIATDGLPYIPTAFGLLATGACMVPIAPTLRPAEQAAILRDTDVNAIIRLAADGTPVLEWIARDLAPAAGFAALDAAFIRFSSGTTADAKGVILSHRAVAARVEAADAVLQLTADDQILWVLPLAYHFAVTIVAYVQAGAHILLASEVAPARLATTADQVRASVLYASPVHFERMAHAASGARLGTVRVAVSTAAPLPLAVADQFENVFGRPLGQAYGIIEAGLPCINLGSAPRGSVGPAVPGYEVAIHDADGAQVPMGTPGEVMVRGPGLFDGYYAPRRPLAECLRAGWFRTGDIGTLDAAGALTLCGRSKSTIITAGMKLFPEEVEACLNALPGVLESRVFGQPHPRLGEIPIAEIVVRPDAPPPDTRTLTTALAQTLSPYKVPVEIRVVDAVPKTPGGKVLRRPV